MFKGTCWMADISAATFGIPFYNGLNSFGI